MTPDVPSDRPNPRQGGEKMINAPLLPVLLALSMPVLFWFQERLPDGGLSMALRPSDLETGQWGGVLTSMLIHFGWAHVGMNAVFALAFGTPVARLLSGLLGGLAFLALYICAGVLSAWGYSLIHAGSDIYVGGASGAVFGLVGAATRLMGARGGVAPIFDKRVLSMSAAWMGVNLLVGVIGFAPGADGVGVAWEAHAIGFVVGLVAIGPLARLFGGGATRQA